MIRKSLSDSKYSVSCTSTENLNEETLNNLNLDSIDCLIMDDEINCKISDKLREKLNSVSTVYLPSLENEKCRDKVVKYISEPLKLSELNEAIESIFKSK
ncbi:MAG TPA: hypothetical protein PKD83_12055 [Ignavibacteria bacterium]|nr:hypothetical protein [Ignavibacteria bacterium]